MKQSLWGSALIVPLAVMSSACGGATFTTGSDDAGTGSSSGAGSGGGGSGSSSGGGSGGGGSGSSSGGCSADCVDSGPLSPCPSQPPGAKLTCAPQGLECEYGSNPVQGCDSVSTCQGTWQSQDPTDPKCSVTLGAGCPGTFDAVPRGSLCSNSALVCNYPRGRCACVQTFGGPIQLVDAAVQGRWVCQDPVAAACPMPRPQLGSVCAQNGLSCDYGTCNVPGGTAEQCEGNLWKPAVVACPVYAGAQ